MIIPFDVSPEFNNGLSCLMSMANYIQYGGCNVLGKDGIKFWAPKNQIDEMLKKYPNDPRTWEEILSLPPGSLGDGDVIRCDLPANEEGVLVRGPRKGDPGTNEYYVESDYASNDLDKGGIFPQTKGNGKENAFECITENCPSDKVSYSSVNGENISEIYDDAAIDKQLDFFVKSYEEEIPSDEELPDFNPGSGNWEDYSDDEIRDLAAEWDEEEKYLKDHGLYEFEQDEGMLRIYDEDMENDVDAEIEEITEVETDTEIEETEDSIIITTTTTTTTTTYTAGEDDELVLF